MCYPQLVDDMCGRHNHRTHNPSFMSRVMPLLAEYVHVFTTDSFLSTTNLNMCTHVFVKRTNGRAMLHKAAVYSAADSLFNSETVTTTFDIQSYRTQFWSTE